MSASRVLAAVARARAPAAALPRAGLRFMSGGHSHGPVKTVSVGW